MDTMPPSELLATQHREIDDGIQAVAEGGGDAGALAASLGSLRRHVYVEEVVLFPPLVESGLAMPVFVMKREHGQMWPLLTQLSDGCAAGRPVADMREAAATLFRLLRMHNPKEEQIVYSAADRLADDKLAAALAAVAEVPDGWVCEGLRAPPPRG